MSYIISLLGLFSGLRSFFEKVLAVIIAEKNKEDGRILERAEIVIKDSELKEEQAKILMKEEERSNTIAKLEDGKF